MQRDSNISGKELQLVRSTYGLPKGSKSIARYDPKYSHGVLMIMPDVENHNTPYEWFFTWDEVELVENMNQEIEVGDKVKYNDGDVFSGKGYRVVKSIFENNVYYEEGGFDRQKDLRVFEKANKQEIVGYELLKDTPELTKGTILKWKDSFDGYIASNKFGGQHIVFSEAIKDTEWFSPIYKEVKPTEVYVDTLAGKVKVTSNEVSLVGETPLTVGVVNVIFERIKKAGNPLPGGVYKLEVETFKVGCKTFHINDIKILEEAIKQVS